MQKASFIRCGVCAPALRLADIEYNVQQHIELAQKASADGVHILVFPELSLTGYTCGDLFLQKSLVDRAAKGLLELARALPQEIIIICGAPVQAGHKLYNCAIIIHNGRIIHAVPKTYLPDYAEFYEKRWFSSAIDIPIGLNTVQIAPDYHTGFGAQHIFSISACIFGVEICEDLWAVQPPSLAMAQSGAQIILNLSASNELSGKAQYRRELVTSQSARCLAAYCYAGAGIGESGMDTVYSGHCLIAENGHLMAESRLFAQPGSIYMADIDIDLLDAERLRNTTFRQNPGAPCTIIDTGIQCGIMQPEPLLRSISMMPFVPDNPEQRNYRCAEIFAIQSAALGRRLQHIGARSIVLGLSGGLDSTLALLACLHTFKLHQWDLSGIICITMPGFGTTHRTKDNSVELANSFGCTLRVIPIQAAVEQHFRDLAHDPARQDILYENAQARERTQILMNAAHQHNAIVIGTGDLSELALGWCTYNGDHMSMYALNAGIPKTLVRYLVEWYADTMADAEQRAVLLDILATPVSPELLPPAKDGSIAQKTEEHIGPYILHDFFLYYLLRHGSTPGHIFYYARTAFRDRFTDRIILHWLRIFYQRFFTQQFKRSCMPDTVKIGSVALSPRADWRMPSDAQANLWLQEIAQLQKEYAADDAKH
jgi:NAD+ synthase (glutamine-hydrolysing)